MPIGKVGHFSRNPVFTSDVNLETDKSFNEFTKFGIRSVTSETRLCNVETGLHPTLFVHHGVALVIDSEDAPTGC